MSETRQGFAATTRRVRGWLLLGTTAWVLSACGGGGGGGGGGGAFPFVAGPPATSTSYPIGGSVAGLSGTVVLRNNGSDDLSLSANGAFQFATQIPAGNPYAVTVARQPDLQTCAVSQGVGSANGAIDSVRVLCSAETFRIGGQVSGLVGTLVLQNNGGDALSLNADGAFRFASVLPRGGAYAVTVRTQPANQTCTVGGGTGVTEGDVTGIAVTCVGAVSPPVPAAPTGLGVGYDVKAYKFTWNASPGATYYQLFESFQGLFITPKVDNIASTSYEYKDVLLLSRADVVIPPAFKVAACNASGCGPLSQPIQPDQAKAIGYFKASATATGEQFGAKVALSGDGKFMAVGTPSHNSHSTAGEVHVFSRAGTNQWRLQAVLTASNADAGDQFGAALKLSGDGAVLSIGAPGEASASTDPNDNSQVGAGAAYVFVRSGETWTQQAYLKSSGGTAGFGTDVAVSGDGNLVAVGAPWDSGLAANAGAAYLFRRAAGNWSLEAKVGADNAGSGDRFGGAVALSGDGTTLAVGAPGESSSAVGNGADNAAMQAGAVYMFGLSSNAWPQLGYLKSGTPRATDFFGGAVALSFNGSRLAIGAVGDTNGGKNVGGFDPGAPPVPYAGAVYTFQRSANVWSLESYVKASNTSFVADFGRSVALSADGSLLAVGSPGDSAASSGINGSDVPGGALLSGGVHVYDNRHGSFIHQAFIKAPNAAFGDAFGDSVSISGDGSMMAVGASREDSAATGINGDQTDNSAGDSGAVYLY